MTLSPRQQRFVYEFLIDLNGRAAAERAGYAAKSEKSLWVQAARLLANVKIRAAVEVEMKARRERLQVDADTVVREFARIAFANVRDFVPREGEKFDLHRLNCDLTAAIEHIEQQEVIDRRTGDICRRLRLKLFDKVPR